MICSYIVLSSKKKKTMTQYYKDIEDKDTRWYTMGKDFGNLRNDCDYICQLFDHRYGISYSVSKKFHRLNRYLFQELSSTLDSVIGNSYPVDIMCLPSYPEQSITGVFYNLRDEPIKRDVDDYSTRFSKNLSQEEKEFINKFIDNLNTYLSYLFHLNVHNYHLKSTLNEKVNKISNYFIKIIINHPM